VQIEEKIPGKEKTTRQKVLMRIPQAPFFLFMFSSSLAWDSVIIDVNITGNIFWNPPGMIGR
jgi:hypothetical protein